MKAAVLLSLAISVVPSAAFAQIAPSDGELRAAYCIPVVRATIHKMDSFFGNSAESASETDRKTLEIVTRQREKLNSDLRRLQAYVLPKLAGPNSDDYLFGFASATKRGEEDYAELIRLSEDCVRKCSGFEAIQCSQSCIEREPVYQRNLPCRSLEWLPF